MLQEELLCSLLLVAAVNQHAVPPRDLRDIASWALDERGSDFINRVIATLEGAMTVEDEDESFPISRKEFLLAFARTLVIDEKAHRAPGAPLAVLHPAARCPSILDVLMGG